MVTRVLDMLRSLTFTNALVMLTLGLVAGPAYLALRIINDDKLLAILLSNYDERALPDTDCALRTASLRASNPTYYISLPWSYAGVDRWYLGVSTPDLPTKEEGEAYCKTLIAIVEYIRNPHESELPTFPRSDRPVFLRPIK